MAIFTRAKLGSNRLCRAVISLTPASLHELMASIVSGTPVAIGFSQKTCLPCLAQALICGYVVKESTNSRIAEDVGGSTAKGGRMRFFTGQLLGVNTFFVVHVTVGTTPKLGKLQYG